MKFKNMDMLRALSALTVIILHITSNYLLRFKALLVINQLARFCVPAFIILSGFVLYKKDRRFHTRNDYLAFYKSRFYRILPPYFIWSFIYLAYRYMKNPEITMKRVLFDVATGQAYIHLYFLFILVQLYFLFPLLSELYKKHEKITTFTTLAITVIFQTFIYLDHLGYIVLPNLIIPYTRIFVPYLFYFVFGIYFRDHYQAFIESLKHYRFGLVILLALSFILVYIDGAISKTYGLSVKPSVIPYTILIFLCAAVFFEYLNGMPEKRTVIPDWFSKQSFSIYFVHPLFISLFYLIAEKSNQLTFISSQAGAVILFLLTMLISCLFAWLLSLFKWAPYFGGVTVDKKPADKNISLKTN